MRGSLPVSVIFLVAHVASQPACPAKCNDNSDAMCQDGTPMDCAATPACSGGPPCCADTNQVPSGPAAGQACTISGVENNAGSSAGSSAGNDASNGVGRAALLGNVGYTTTAGNIEIQNRAGGPDTVQVNGNIYGPFEAGFDANGQQANILQGMGCEAGVGTIPGGLDTHLSERIVSKACEIELPRIDPTTKLRVSFLDSCGGHTDYHLHERLRCLYTDVDGSGHSSKIGEAVDGTPLYGKWEDYSTGTLPALDWCGGHWGKTPESPNEDVYHYHIQDLPPFTFGCFGPNADGKAVTREECRATYAAECSGSDITAYPTNDGDVRYDPWCPCYDAAGSNIVDDDTAPDDRIVAMQTANNLTPSPTTKVTPSPTPSPTTKPSTGNPASSLPNVLIPMSPSVSPSMSPVTIAAAFTVETNIKVADNGLTANDYNAEPLHINIRTRFAGAAGTKVDNVEMVALDDTRRSLLSHMVAFSEKRGIIGRQLTGGVLLKFTVAAGTSMEAEALRSSISSELATNTQAEDVLDVPVTAIAVVVVDNSCPDGVCTNQNDSKNDDGSSSGSGGGGGGMGSGTLIGAAVGGGVVFFLLIGLAYHCLVHKRAKRATPTVANV